jgi:hypothetical protein
MLFLLGISPVGTAGETEPVSIAVLVRHDAASRDLGGKLEPLLEAEVARQWQGKVVDRAELKRLLDQMEMAGSGPNSPENPGRDGHLQFGKLSHADSLFTVRVTTTSVRATVTRFPGAAVIHEKIYRERLEPESLAVRITADALKAFRESGRDPNRPHVSVGSFYYADPHRRFFHYSRDVRMRLRQSLAETEDIVLVERLFPSDILDEFELTRSGLTAQVARNLSAPAADILLHGEFRPQPDQELDSKATVMDWTLIALSPTGLCGTRREQFSCRSNDPQVVTDRASKLLQEAGAEARMNLSAGMNRRFSEQEFQVFKKQSFRLMPTSPLEDGAFYHHRSYRGPFQYGTTGDLERALHMLECAMLFKGNDTQVLVCMGALLDGLAGAENYSGEAKEDLLVASYELIERSYRLESNWNTRGMFWRFCMLGGRSPAQCPHRLLEAARHIWNARHTEPWRRHMIDSALTKLIGDETEFQKQQGMFLEAAREYMTTEDGLRNLFRLFGAFTTRVSRSDGDPEILQQASGFADRLLAEQPVFMQSLGHLLHLSVYSEMGDTGRDAKVPEKFATHFRAAIDILPELHQLYGKEFTRCSYSGRLRDFFETYEKVVNGYRLNDDVAECKEQYIDAQMRAGNYDDGGIVHVFRTLLPVMWERRKYDRAHALITEFLKHYGVGGSADYDRMWLARERNRFAFAVRGKTPFSIDRLEKIEFDDGRNGWVTKVVVGENGVFGIRSGQWFRNGQAFRLALASRRASILKHPSGAVCDLACSDRSVGIATESNGFHLLNGRTLETRRFTPQNSGFPGRTVRLVCSEDEDFFVAVADKENLYALVYRLKPGAAGISRTETKFVPHTYWRMKANTLGKDVSPVLPQTWYQRTALEDGETLEFSCSRAAGAEKEVTVKSGLGDELLRYLGFELSYVFDFVLWQGQLIFATGNGIYVCKPSSNQIRCLLSEPDLLSFCLLPLDDRMYIGTSRGLYSLEAKLFLEILI